MVKQELIAHSPVRLFEQSIKGGLKAGEMGVIASSNGVGKTSVLVQIALDKLLQAQKVIHVSFTQHNDYVLAWYENIFNEFIKKQGVEDLVDLKDTLIKNRVLMHFNQAGMSGEQILRSLKAMIQEGGFKAEILIIDGFDFAQTKHEDLAQVKAFAQELGLSIWYSCNVQDGAYNGQRIPLLLQDYLDLMAVVIVLEPKPDHIALSVSKYRDTCHADALALQLDPRTLLFCKDKVPIQILYFLYL